MIKNGGRLIARAVKSRTHERARLKTACCSKNRDAVTPPPPPAGPAVLPPAFLLPAWHTSEEKIVATRGGRRRSSSIHRQQACRHASTHAQAELTRTHDAYSPDWLTGDNCDSVPTASTSKAVHVPSLASEPITDVPDENMVRKAPKVDAEQVQTAAVAANDKGKAVERSVATPPPPAKTRRRSPTKHKNGIDTALRAARGYLTQEGDTVIPPALRKPQGTHQQFDLPLDALAPSIRNLLQHDPPLSSTPPTHNQHSSIQRHLSLRCTYASNILSAYFQHYTKTKQPLSTSHAASVRKSLRQIVFLDKASISTLLESLSILNITDNANASRLIRIIPDVLAVHILRQVEPRAIPQDSAATPKLTLSASEIRSNTILRILGRLSRTLTTLSDPYRQALVRAHLPAMTALIASLPPSQASTAAIAFQILDCCYVSETHGTVETPNLDDAMQALLDLSLAVLDHALQPVKVGVTNPRLHAKHLEDSLLRTWTHSIVPFLQEHYTDSVPSDNIVSALSSMQDLACCAGMARLAAQIAFDTGTNRYSTTGPAYLRVLPDLKWQEIIRVCLRAGETDRAAMLLGKMSDALGSSDDYNSLLWHSKLLVILKTPCPDCKSQDKKFGSVMLKHPPSPASAFFERLDGLLREMEDAGHKPDHHFLNTFLRHIPSFPTSLDRSCDLFHVALSLSRKTVTPTVPGQHDRCPVALHARLAASHSNIALFERGKREAVQLPWSPLSSVLNEEFQVKSAGCRKSALKEALLRMTRESQVLRLAILQNRRQDACTAFSNITENFAAIVRRRDEPDGARPGSAAQYETAKQLWTGAYIRHLSERLHQRDWMDAHAATIQALDSLGSRFVGAQAIKRLLHAACSPVFHSQDVQSTSSRQSSPTTLGWPKLASALWMTTKWVEDIRRCELTSLSPEVDVGLTVTQRLRSVVEAGYTTQTLARSLAMYAVSSKYSDERRQDMYVDEVQAIELFLSTMISIHCNVNYSAWWLEVEKNLLKQVEIWKSYTGRSVEQQLRWVDMERVCHENEQKRAARVASLNVAK